MKHYCSNNPVWSWALLLVAPLSLCPFDSHHCIVSAGVCLYVRTIPNILALQKTPNSIFFPFFFFFISSEFCHTRILEWIAYPFSRESSQPRNQTGVLCIAGGFFTNWAIRDSIFIFPVPVLQLANSRKHPGFFHLKIVLERKAWALYVLVADRTLIYLVGNF